MDDPRLQEIADAVKSFDSDLDDVARARIESRVLQQLDRPRIEPFTHARRWPTYVLAAAAAVAALSLGALLLRQQKDEAHVEKTMALRVLGTSEQVERVQAGAGQLVRAALGDRAELALYGPGELRVISGARERIVLALSSGFLYADVEYDPQRRFLVEAPGHVVEVVGTLFFVDAREVDRLRVGVDRGAVEVRPPGLQVIAGEVWDSRPPPASTAVEPPIRQAEERKPELTAEQLYRRAEKAMAKNDDAGAIAALRELVRRFADDRLADSALLELARLSEKGGRRAQAREYLEELLARRGDDQLAESAHHLLCTIHAEDGAPERAIECLSTFRRRFPHSAHDRAVLRALAGLAERTGGCKAALPWVEELAVHYPDDPLAKHLEERRRRCTE